MGKIADVQLRSKAAILAQEGYSYSVIGHKLGRSKGWVAKWVERSKQGELRDHARCGRPKISTQAAIKKARIWIETDRKISQGRWTEGQQRNNQKLHESGEVGNVERSH